MLHDLVIYVQDTGIFGVWVVDQVTLSELFCLIVL